jgi:hypothetical protein
MYGTIRKEKKMGNSTMRFSILVLLMGAVLLGGIYYMRLIKPITTNHMHKVSNNDTFRKLDSADTKYDYADLARDSVFYRRFWDSYHAFRIHQILDSAKATWPKPLDVARVREIVDSALRKHDSACAARVQGVWVPTELDHFPGAVPDTAWAWRKR